MWLDRDKLIELLKLDSLGIDSPIPLNLSTKDMERVDNIVKGYKEGKSSDIGKKAEAIVSIFLEKTIKKCHVMPQRSGPDLKIVLPNKKSFEVEVKGTSDKSLAFSKLKVSSKQSWEALRNGVPMFRVAGVSSSRPLIYILWYRLDFRMKKEPRWSVKRNTKRKVGRSGALAHLTHNSLSTQRANPP